MTDDSGWLSYPVDKIRENEEIYPLPPLHCIVNTLSLYHIPENDKWCYGVHFADKRPSCRGEGWLPYPLGENYDSRQDAINAGYDEYYKFAALGVGREEEQDDQNYFDFGE